MWSHKKLLLASAMLMLSAPALAAPECHDDWLNQSADLEGLVFGTNLFEAEISPDLSFKLVPDDTGWRAQLIGGEGQDIPTRPVARGIPPGRGSNNPHMSFVFGPDIFDPALNPEFVVPGRPPNVAAVEPSPGQQGSGQITILEQGFAPEPQTRRVYMKFEGCLNWNSGPREPDISAYSSPETLANFPSWVVLAFEDCGLPRTHLLSGRMPRAGYRQRAWLEPDIDGDGRPDLVALVDNSDTGTSHLAICQQKGKALTILRADADDSNQTLSSDFLREIDWWSVDGRSFILGIEGAGSQRVYRHESGEIISAWEGD